MGYESWSPELQGSAQSRPIPLGPEHAGTMVVTYNKMSHYNESLNESLSMSRSPN